MTAALNAFIVQEILDAFSTLGLFRTEERDRIQTEFLERLPGMLGLIQTPFYRDIAANVIENRRQAAEVQLLAEVLQIQPKDVPILVLPYRTVEREPTILMHDEAFSECVPAEHNLPGISIEHVA